MNVPDELNIILNRIANHQQSEADITVLRQWLSSDSQIVTQTGKYVVNLAQGQDIHVGDRIYQGVDAEAIREIIESLLQELPSHTQALLIEKDPLSVDELVQQVRSRLYDDIQRLHGTMTLWGVDHWVPLGELFVDVNILEELSSSYRAELDDLWQDFTTGMQGYSSYRSLDRIGLGRERQRVSGLEVLKKNSNLMVVGKPGSGKSTYLQRVVTECNAGNLQAHRIPVLIKLREFLEEGRSLSYSLECYLAQCWQLSTAETQLVLKQGQSLVLLDGLDEVMGEDGKTITRQIKQFARAYPQVQMIVTCRTQSFSGEMDWKSLRFSFVEVADFNEVHVRSFAEHWFKTVMVDEAVGLAKAREFLEQLFREENKPIRELAITPILLSLTCAVFQQTGKFYSKRSKLYEEGLELLLEQWDKSREIERDEIYRDLPVERRLELLSYLAVKKFEQEQYVLFEQAEIEGYIAEFLGIGARESRGVLRAIEAQHGLLIERSQKIWSFSHLTFQEYLAATLFCKNKDWRCLSKQVFDKKFREILVICTGILHSSEAEKLLQEMKNKIDDFLTSNVKMQNFLEWIDERVKSGKNFCKLSAMRAFFLEIAVSNDLDNSSLHNSIHTVISHMPLSSLSDSTFKPSLNMAIADVHHYSWSTNLMWRISGHVPYTCIFEIEKSHKVTDWFAGVEENALVLSHLIDEKQNITSKWRFIDEETLTLQQYCDANEILMDCLNGSMLTQAIKEKYEDLLLLPIAEVERRKRKKVE